jgi:hypothetical protein
VSGRGIEIPQSPVNNLSFNRKAGSDGRWQSEIQGVSSHKDQHVVERRIYDYYHADPEQGRFKVQMAGRTLFDDVAGAAMGYVAGEWELKHQFTFEKLEPVIKQNFADAGYGDVVLQYPKETRRPTTIGATAEDSHTRAYLKVPKATDDSPFATRFRKSAAARKAHTTHKSKGSMTGCMHEAGYVSDEGAWRLGEYGRSLGAEFDAAYCGQIDSHGKFHESGVYENCTYAMDHIVYVFERLNRACVRAGGSGATMDAVHDETTCLLAGFTLERINE